MKKAAALLVTAIIFASCLFADVTTDSATLNVSAYKETAIPSMSYTITIKDFNSSNLTGVTTVLDISNKMKTSRTLEEAFTITINSNLKASIPIVIEFSPLINQEDAAADPIPVTYTMTKETLTEVQARNPVSVNRKSYYYYYTPAIGLTNNATTVDVNGTSTSTTLTHSVGSIRRWRNNTYENNVPMPSTTESTLPGFANGQVLTSSAVFNLVIDEVEYNNMPANVDHVATVKLTITPL